MTTPTEPLTRASSNDWHPTWPPRKLSDIARHVVVPSGIVSTGWNAVEAKAASMGLTFDPWQRWAGAIFLGKRADGTYAATVGGIVLSIPRQVGKTYLLGAVVFALCAIFPNMTIIWTAHRTKTSDETFRSMQGLARRPDVMPHIEAVRTANGQQTIAFKNGSRILFGAREMGFGRGFAEIDVIVFDEASIMTEKSLDDMVPSTNSSRFPAGALLFFIGTPPRPTDPGEVFTNRREEALSGKSDDMVYVEFSADRNASPDDEEQWKIANPSYPKRTKKISIQRMRKNLNSDDAFLREALGVWGAADARTVIDTDSWVQAGDSDSIAVENLSLGIDVAPDMTHASVSLAGQRADGAWHIEVIESRKGTGWVVPFVSDVLERNPGLTRAVVLDEGGPARPLMDEFKKARIRVSTPRVNDVGTACARFYDGIMHGAVFHTNQPHMDVARLAARKRNLGQTGMWAWSRMNVTSDITPIVSATLALWGAQSQDRIVKPQRKSAGNKPKVRWA